MLMHDSESEARTHRCPCMLQHIWDTFSSCRVCLCKVSHSNPQISWCLNNTQNTLLPKNKQIPNGNTHYRNTPSLAKEHTHTIVEATCRRLQRLFWITASIHRPVKLLSPQLMSLMLLFSFFFPWFAWCSHVGELGVATPAAAYSLARVTYNFYTFLKPRHGQYGRLETLQAQLTAQNASDAALCEQVSRFDSHSVSIPPLSTRGCVTERQ